MSSNKFTNAYGIEEVHGFPVKVTPCRNTLLFKNTLLISNKFTDAYTTEETNEFPIKFRPCIKTPWFKNIPSNNFWLVMVALMAIYPPVKPFPKKTISGVMSLS